MTLGLRRIRRSLPDLRVVGAALLYGLLPNLPFWVATHFLKVDRPYIVLDYLVSGALFAYGWRKLASVLLVVFVLVDGLSIQGLVYPVLHPADVFYLLTLLPYAPSIWKLAAVSGLVLLVMMVGMSWRFARTSNRLAALVLLGLASGAGLCGPVQAGPQ